MSCRLRPLGASSSVYMLLLVDELPDMCMLILALFFFLDFLELAMGLLILLMPVWAVLGRFFMARMPVCGIGGHSTVGSGVGWGPCVGEDVDGALVGEGVAGARVAGARVTGAWVGAAVFT